MLVAASACGRAGARRCRVSYAGIQAVVCRRTPLRVCQVQGHRACSTATDEDLIVFSSNNTWKFRALGAVGLFKAMAWSYLGYTSYMYPASVDHLSPMWSLLGLGMSGALLFTAQSLAANTVKEIVRTHSGVAARITTFNVFGGANAPATVPIDSLSCQDMHKAYYHLKVGSAKNFVLLDKSGTIPDASAFDNLVHGRTIYSGTGTKRNRHVQWLEATDPQSGKTYWYHPVTRQTSWVNPNN